MAELPKALLKQKKAMILKLLETKPKFYKNMGRCIYAKIIFISTISAFADAKSVYGQIKFSAEQVAAQYGAVTVRPGLIFYKEQRGIVLAMQKFIKLSPIVPLIGRGDMKFYPCRLVNLAQLLQGLLCDEFPWSEGPIIAANASGASPTIFRSGSARATAQSSHVRLGRG